MSAATRRTVARMRGAAHIVTQGEEDHAWVEAAREAAVHVLGTEEVTLTHLRSSIAHVFAASAPPCEDVVVRLLPGRRAPAQQQHLDDLTRLTAADPYIALPPLRGEVLAGECPGVGAWVATAWPRALVEVSGVGAARELGRVLARLHALRELELTPSREDELGQWHIDEKLRERIARLPESVQAEAWELRAELIAQARVTELPAHVASFGVCHGDVKPDNLVYLSPGDPGRGRLIDWDNLHWGPRGAELTKWGMGVLLRGDSPEAFAAGMGGWYGLEVGDPRADQLAAGYLRGPWMALRAWNAGAWQEWDLRFGQGRYEQVTRHVQEVAHLPSAAPLS